MGLAWSRPAGAAHTRTRWLGLRRTGIGRIGAAALALLALAAAACEPPVRPRPPVPPDREDRYVPDPGEVPRPERPPPSEPEPEVAGG